MDYLETVQDKRTEDAERRKEEFAQQQLVSATKAAGKTVSDTVSSELDKSRKSVQKVSVQESLATPDDIKGVVKALDSLAVKLRPEAIEWQPVLVALKEVSAELKKLPKTLPDIPKPLDTVAVSNLKEFERFLLPLTKSIEKLELSPVFDPKITVKPADVSVNEQKIDIEPMVKAIKELKAGITGLAKNTVASEDLTPLIEATKSTTKAINSLQFPVANYILPFKDPTTGKATQVVLTTDGKMPVEAVLGTTNYATKIDEDSTTSGIFYVGKAAIGSSAASAVWQIKKLNTTSIDLDKTWCDGDDSFNNVWNNRESLSYS